MGGCTERALFTWSAAKKRLRKAEKAVDVEYENVNAVAELQDAQAAFEAASEHLEDEADMVFFGQCCE